MYYWPMSIKLVIFDLDGTLVNSIKDITNAINYAIKPIGIHPKTVEEVGALVGEGITRVIESILGDNGLSYRDEAVARFLEFYSEHIADYTMEYPGVRETLKDLNEYKKAVISNKREGLSVKVLEKLGLIKHFEMVLGSDSTGEKKPSPVPVNHVLSTLGIKPQEAVMVGDSNLDIEAGKGAGVTTIGVTYGYRERSYLTDADFIINDIKEIPGVILDLKNK